MRVKPVRRLIEILFLGAFVVIGVLVVWGGIPFSQTPDDDLTMTPAMFWKELPGNAVQCQLCFRSCTIPEGGRGYCTARINKGGKLYSLVYGAVTTQIDPVEKEPLFHFLPGTQTLCFGTAGCNFRCTFCHNWHLAARTPEQVGLSYLSPEEAVDTAIESGVTSVSFTYNEPTVFYEWVYDVCKLAQDKGIRTYFHTNAGIQPEPLKELLKHLDAVCVDLKGFTAKFYEDTSFSELEPVLNTLKTIEESKVWFEIVNLVIPGMNDDPAHIREMCRWIKENLGEEVPVHFTRFHPAYKLTKLPPTPIETLERAREIAFEEGLKYVTIGNVPDREFNSTFCPQCGEILIERVGFSVLENNIEDGRCLNCNHEIPGVWE
ncbi:MAG: AmmeMemoRadiSam system radical SAM enzyme [Dehalococcoidia bacterium]